MSNEELVKLIQSNINPVNNLQQLYIQNERFIGMIARRYTHNKDDIDDLMQQGYFGLIKAAKHYDFKAGVHFITYATFWIKQSMINYYKNNGMAVRLPSYMHSCIRQYETMLSTFKMANGRGPSDKEICQCMKISKTKLDAIKQALIVDSIQSLDEPIPDTEETTLIDSIQDKSVDIENSVIDSIMESSIHTDLWKIVKDNVTQREYDVLVLRYRDNMTLEATRRELGLSREGVRQVELRALRKLRTQRIKRILSERVYLC